MVIGDLNIDYLTMTEKECLDTVIVPYSLSVCNSSTPTRVTGQSSPLIDYIITLAATKSGQVCTLVSDTLVKSRHKATLSIFNSELSHFCKPIREKKIALKTTVSRHSVL